MPTAREADDDPEKRPQFDRRHHEGYLSIGAGNLYYREFGTGEAVLVGLHGGPGATQDYLAPLVDLAGDERTVYLYDQYGCGRSDGPPENVFDHYTVEGYRERLDEVRRAIGADQLHLYGQSWGGWLALSYVLSHPDRVASLVLANTSAGIERAAEAMRAAARSCLDDDDRDRFDELVADRAVDEDAFETLVREVDDHHINRSDAEPFAFAPPSNPTIYGLMWGPSEYVLADTARLRGWSVADRLGEIDCPTLVLNGEYDEIAPELGAEMADAIPDARFVEFDDASHLPLWEVRETHTRVVRSFLDEQT